MMEKKQETNVQSDSVMDSPKPSNAPLIYYGVAFALLGLSAGIFAGLSNSPVVGVLLPLLFGLIGGANGIYLSRVDLTNKVDRRRLSLIGQMLSAFLIFLLSGSFYGILVRTGVGLSALVPPLQSEGAAPIDSATISDLDTLDPGTALELTLLRYRLQELGANVDEQRMILATAKDVLAAPVNREQMTGIFEHLINLFDQVYIMSSQYDDYDDSGIPNPMGEVEDFILDKQRNYEYVIDALPEYKVPIEAMVDLIDEDRDIFSRLIRDDYWNEAYKTEWLRDKPELRQKLWEIELAYMDASYELQMRKLGWRSGQPLAETIDQLIQARGSQVPASAESDITGDSLRPGLAP